MLCCALFLLCVSSMFALNYDTFQFVPVNSYGNFQFFIGQDLNHLIVSSSNIVGLDYYTTNQNIITYMYQVTATNVNLVGANRNLSMIYTYSSVQQKLRVFSRSGTIITLIQQIIPSATICTTAQFAADGSRFTIGFTNVIISYVYNGAQYVLDSNTTVPATYAPSAYRAISPDGKFMIYGQSVPSARLRILWMNPGLGFTQIPWVSTSIGVSSWFDSITISTPSFGVYDIIFKNRSTWYSIFYMKFDSNTNTAIISQTMTYMISSTFGGSSANNILSLNGKYLAITDRGFSLMILYQKVAGVFQQIYNTTVLGYSSMPYFVSDDGNMIIILNGGFQLGFMFICRVDNCHTCSWENACSICNTGFTLIGTACQCSSGNISVATGNCVTCNVPSCYHCSYDDVCDAFQPVSTDNKKTQTLVSVLFAIVCLMVGVLGFMIYKLIKNNSSSVNANGELVQKSAKSVADIKNDQSRDQLSMNENHNQQSHQTLAQSRKQPSLTNSIQSNLQLNNFGLTLSDSNIVQVRARKKKRNMDFNEPIEDNFQEISIQNIFRKEAEKQ